MELILKAGAAALLCALTGLLIKKHNPEATLLLGAAASAGILIASLGILNGFQELRRQLEKMLGAGGELLLAPIVKCLAIAIVTRFATDLCRDASQNALASAVEMAGTACAMTAVLPLLLSVMKMIGELT